MGITRAQRKFVERYMANDFRNATDAYRQAYPRASYDTARANAAKLLAKTSIQDYMSAAVAEVLDREKLTLEKRIFDYWTRRAFYDLTAIIGLDGQVKITEDELRAAGLEACIDSINKKITAQGDTVITYKFADRDAAVGMLQKYISMIHEKLEITGIPPEASAALKRFLDAQLPGGEAPRE
jgi:hypothetical protein